MPEKTVAISVVTKMEYEFYQSTTYFKKKALKVSDNRKFQNKMDTYNYFVTFCH